MFVYTLNTKRQKRPEDIRAPGYSPNTANIQVRSMVCGE